MCLGLGNKVVLCCIVVQSGAIVLIVGGAVLLVLGFLGCCGAVKEVRCLLATVSAQHGVIYIFFFTLFFFSILYVMKC